MLEVVSFVFEFAWHCMSGVSNLFLIYPNLSLFTLYFIIFACLVLYSLADYSFNDLVLSLFSLFILLNIGLLFYQASFSLVVGCAIVAFIYPKVKQDHVLNPASIMFLLTVTIFSTIGSARASIINIFSFVPPWLALGVAICAGIGFSLLYLDGLSAWLYKNYNAQTDIGRFKHYKQKGEKLGLEGNVLNKYIAIRFLFHKLKITKITKINEIINNQELLSDFEDKAKVKVKKVKEELKKKIRKLDNKGWGLSRLIRSAAWLLGSCNYLISNPIISMVGGALFVGGVFGSISIGFLVFAAVSFFMAGSFLAFAASMPYLRKLASKFDFWVHQENKSFNLSSVLKILLASFVVLASTGNAYYSGFNLLAKFQILLGADNYLSVLLSHAPAWLPYFIGICSAFITFFIAIALYYTAIDEKIDAGYKNIKYASLKDKLGLVFSAVSGLGLGFYFYDRLNNVLTLWFGGGAIVSIVSVIAGVLIAVNFMLSIQGKVQGKCLENAKQAFIPSFYLEEERRTTVKCSYNKFKSSNENFRDLEDLTLEVKASC